MSADFTSARRKIRYNRKCFAQNGRGQFSVGSVIPKECAATVIELKSGRVITGIRSDSPIALTVITANETLVLPKKEVEIADAEKDFNDAGRRRQAAQGSGAARFDRVFAEPDASGSEGGGTLTAGSTGGTPVLHTP
jgi:hypothetical protein